MYLLNHNILAHPQFLHFYVPTWPYAPLINPFLCIYSTIVFLLIRDTSFSTYLLDHNILAHPRFHHFFVSTRPSREVMQRLRMPLIARVMLFLAWQSLEILMVLIRVVQCLAMFFASMDAVLWLIHHHIGPPLWNAKGFDRELLLVSFLCMATLTMTQVPFRSLDGLTRGCYHQANALQKSDSKLFISADIQCLLVSGLRHCITLWPFICSNKRLKIFGITLQYLLASCMNQHHPPLYLFNVFFCFSNWTCVNCSAICRFTVAEQKSMKIVAQKTWYAKHWKLIKLALLVPVSNHMYQSKQ